MYYYRLPVEIFQEENIAVSGVFACADAQVVVTPEKIGMHPFYREPPRIICDVAGKGLQLSFFL